MVQPFICAPPTIYAPLLFYSEKHEVKLLNQLITFLIFLLQIAYTETLIYRASVGHQPVSIYIIVYEHYEY